MVPEAAVQTERALRIAGINRYPVQNLDQFGTDVRTALGRRAAPRADPAPAHRYAATMATPSASNGTNEAMTSTAFARVA
ncbi:hypothetical protein ACIGB8_22455 [Promicromonospora sukumoe]|uniref:hypothetical protein n=1 Tax=Promicromonospora sukumoe TaxID=88382 RepID=UPI0037CA0C76